MDPRESPEHAVMKAALGFQDITVDIPEGATLPQVEQTLGIAVEGYKRLYGGIERIKPIIGRIILAIEDRKLYRPTYKNMTEFLRVVVEGQMQFSHTAATDALRIARKFSTLSVEQYQTYGATRLLYAAQVTSDQDEGYKELLDESTRMTVEQFKEKVDIQRAEGRKAPSTVVLTMRVSPETKGEFESLLEASQQTPGDFMTALLFTFKTGRKPA